MSACMLSEMACFFPCGHVCCCSECWLYVERRRTQFDLEVGAQAAGEACPLCRKDVTNWATVRPRYVDGPY